MLSSIVLELQAVENGRFQGSSGRAVHGFWFNQWAAVAPDLADSLHQQATKPFTLSPLMGLARPRQGVTHVRAGDKAWLRVTSLQAELSQKLLGNWLPRLPAVIRLAEIPWRIDNIALMPQAHPWAQQNSYAALEAAAPTTVLEPTWRLQIETPTTFHIGKDAYLPFPLPGALVNSWRRRWDAFAEVKLPPIEATLLQQQLFISHYRLKTVPVRYGRRVTMGCVGELTLRAGKLPDEVCRTISILAAYAFYCGNGRYTTQGMGLTRLAHNRQAP
ncbi:MAG: CRISPR-associated endoribonuclease Cas6 [Chloroflexota bacterium]